MEKVKNCQENKTKLYDVIRRLDLGRKLPRALALWKPSRTSKAKHYHNSTEVLVSHQLMVDLLVQNGRQSLKRPSTKQTEESLFYETTHHRHAAVQCDARLLSNVHRTFN